MHRRNRGGERAVHVIVFDPTFLPDCSLSLFFLVASQGTLPYTDLMLGLDFLLNESDYAANLDPERLGAAGASYGGVGTRRCHRLAAPDWPSRCEPPTLEFVARALISLALLRWVWLLIAISI